jgi:serine/threonine protein kinase/tetratricopeptide (TPR) repeat protein
MSPNFSPSARLGHYEIKKQLGAGGMGEVYLAQDTKLDRKVAIKVLPENMSADAQAKRRLLREARAAAKLDHSNVCSIYEVGEDDGVSFIVMQYLLGESLDVRIKRQQLDLRDAVSIATQVADALAEAHAHGIIHRDIKPSNIMITERGQVKVMDFGLATLTQQHAEVDCEAATRSLLTSPGAVVGTMPYMSPEQIQGEKVDARSDVFSFGTVLYEMLTGRQPFVADSGGATLAAILVKTPAPLSYYVADAPEELQHILAKCLEKKREHRYQTMREVMRDLETIRNSLATSQISKLKYSETTDNQTPQGSRSFFKYQTNLIAAAVLAALAVGLLIYVWRVRPTTDASQQEIKSLAVLPLKSFDAGENVLGPGIADAVIRRISQTGKLIVRPMSAVRRYLNEETDGLAAAKQLEVDSVLEGTVQRADERLRVSVNLLRTSDGTSLWAESFDMNSAADIFTIQDTIAQRIVSRLQLQLNPAQKERLGKVYTSIPEAYGYFVKARTNYERVTTAIGDRQAIDATIDYLKRAVELDPQFALAYATLGDAYMWMANFNDPENPVWVQRAQEALSRAELLDPQLAEIHSARFQYYFSEYAHWDLARAAREARQALALNPSVGHGDLGTIYDHLGLDEAVGLQEFERALEIDPTNAAAQIRLVESYCLYGKFDKANEAYRRFFGAGAAYPKALIGSSRLDEAESVLNENLKKNPGDVVGRAQMVLLLALKGRFQEAESQVAPLLQNARHNRAYHHVTYDIACTYALEGKVDEAVKWLRVTAETGMPNYPLFARDRNLDRIRGKESFVQLMVELKPRWEGYKREFE